MAVPTKVLRVDQDVVQQLKCMKLEEANNKFFATLPKLERKLYVDVNKALEALGGRWEKTLKCHVFATDPRPQLNHIYSTGSYAVEQYGFFSTPREVIRRMFNRCPPSDGKVLEPSAGEGAIVDTLYAEGIAKADMICVELHEGRARTLLEKGYKVGCADFMAVETCPVFTRAYMNPPFHQGQDMSHVRHAFGFLRPGGRLAAIMSPHYTFATDNRSISFRQWIADKEPLFENLPPDSFKASGTSVNTVLLILTKAAHHD